MINIDMLKAELTALETRIGTLDEIEKVQLLRLKTELNYYKAVATAEYARSLAKPENKSKATRYIERRKKSLDKSIKKLEKKQLGGNSNSFFHKRRTRKIEERKEELAKLKDFSVNGKGFAEYIMAKQGDRVDKSKVINKIANSAELVSQTGNGMCLFLEQDANGNTMINEANVNLALSYISGDHTSYDKLVEADKKDKELSKIDGLFLEVPERVDRFVNKLEERNILTVKHVNATHKLNRLNSRLARHSILSNFMLIEKMRVRNLTNKQAAVESSIRDFDTRIKDDYDELAYANAVNILPPELAGAFDGTADYFEVVALGSNIEIAKQEIVDDARLGYANRRVTLENETKAIMDTVPLKHKTADFNCLEKIASSKPKSAEQLSEAKESLESLLRINAAYDPLSVQNSIAKLLTRSNRKDARAYLKTDVIDYSRDKTSRR